MRDAVLGLCGLAAFALCACAGDLEHPENFAFLRAGDSAVPSGGAPPACVTDYFENTCGGACHGKESALLDLTSPGVETRLIGQPSSADSVCGGRTLVATDGSQSLLLQKLTTAPCGSQMPFGGTADPAAVDCIRNWITSLNMGVLDDDGGT